MLKNYLKIKYIAIARYIRAIGVLYLLFLLPIAILFFMAFVNNLLSIHENIDLLLAAAFVFVLVSYSSGRKDIAFIQINNKNYLFLVLLVDNCLITVLALLLALFTTMSLYGYLMFLPAPLIATWLTIQRLKRFQRVRKFKKVQLAPNYFSIQNIELRLGVRRYFAIYMILLAALLLSFALQNYFICLVSIEFLALQIASSYFLDKEPISVAWQFNGTKTQFLIQRIKYLLKDNWLLGIFFILILVLFPTKYLLTLFAVFITMLMLIGSLFLKYAFFPLNLGTHIIFSIFIGITITSFLSPLLVILAVVFVPLLFYKAYRNLSIILWK